MAGRIFNTCVLHVMNVIIWIGQLTLYRQQQLPAGTTLGVDCQSPPTEMRLIIRARAGSDDWNFIRQKKNALTALQ